jgi:hypothetical protein
LITVFIPYSIRFEACPSQLDTASLLLVEFEEDPSFNLAKAACNLMTPSDLLPTVQIVTTLDVRSIEAAELCSHCY